MGSVDRWNRQYAVNKSSGGGAWWRPEQGENLVRVFPFMHKVTEGDFALGRYLPSEVKVGETVEEFNVPYRSHFKPERGTCGLIRRADKKLVGDCGTCNKAADVNKSDSKEDRKIAKDWSARTQFNVQIIDIDKDIHNLKVWSAPQAFMDWILKQMGSRAYQGDTLLGENGMDILVTYDKDATPNQMYAFSFMPKEKTAKLKLSDLKAPPRDLFNVLEYLPPSFQVYITNPVGSPTAENGASEAPKAVPAQTPAPAKQAEAPEPAPGPKKRGRPPKAKEEPKDDFIQIGASVAFLNGTDRLTGKITAGPDQSGLFDVELENGEVYGVAAEEIQTV